VLQWIASQNAKPYVLDRVKKHKHERNLQVAIQGPKQSYHLLDTVALFRVIKRPKRHGDHHPDQYWDNGNTSKWWFRALVTLYYCTAAQSPSGLCQQVQNAFRGYHVVTIRVNGTQRLEGNTCIYKSAMGGTARGKGDETDPWDFFRDPRVAREARTEDYNYSLI
jgi:hypothetical protein